MDGRRPLRGVRRGVVVIIASAAVAFGVSGRFAAHLRQDEIVPGRGVTTTGWLSDYLPVLRGTPGDSEVYVMEGRDAGGTAMVLGGTHADEPAGYLAAVVLVERAQVRAGRLLVVPRANASGFTHTVPLEGHPTSFAISTPYGQRRFSFGARATNPVHQWPDPQVYVHGRSGQVLSGVETRNLNRCYPGRADGTLTERVAFAILELIRREAVDLAVDLHEAAPEYPVVNTIVAHERAADLAATVNFELQVSGVPIGIEASPMDLHGLSHREWGDATDVLAVLMETTNPAQGRLRGRTDSTLVCEGRDRFYVAAARRGRLSVPFTTDGWPLSLRVGRHLEGVGRFLALLGEARPGRGLVVTGLPSLDDLSRDGIGRYLSPPPGRENGGVG